MPTSNTGKPEFINESKYRSLFTKLIKKHAGAVRLASPANGNNDGADNLNLYQTESKLIQNAIASERNAVIAGVAVGIAAFASFRYGPAFLVKRLGGEKKARALKEAEEASRKDPYGWAKSSFSLCIETLFGAWAGVRGYTIVSREMIVGGSNKDDHSIFQDIAKIPLVEGRSIVAETICEEWMDVAYHQVPKTFWRHVKEEKEYGSSSLSDPRAWKAIADFAINCQKRKVYMDTLRDKRNNQEEFITDSQNQTDSISIPSPGVPTNIQVPQDLFSSLQITITNEEAKEIVADN